MNKEMIYALIKKYKRMYSVEYSGNTLVMWGRKFFTVYLPTQKMNTYPEIHPVALKIAFLPDDKLLVDGGADGMYHLISVREGKLLASCKAPGNRWMRAPRFAVSPNGDTAFDFWMVKDQYYLARINLDTFTFEQIPVQLELRTLRDIVYVSNNEVYVLQQQVDGLDGKYWIVSRINSIRITQSGCISLRRYQWNSPNSSSPYATDGRYILYDNLYAMDLQTGNHFSLLENSEYSCNLKYGILGFIFHSNHGLLQLCSEGRNDFIDCNTQKIIACYSLPGNTYIGCRIEDEFWFGTEKGIERRPFPSIECL